MLCRECFPEEEKFNPNFASEGYCQICQRYDLLMLIYIPLDKIDQNYFCDIGGEG